MSKTYGVVETRVSNRHVDLQSIEEKREDSGSRAPSMAESEHCIDSNKSGLGEETNQNSINTLSLFCKFYAQEVEKHLDFCKNGI